MFKKMIDITQANGEIILSMDDVEDEYEKKGKPEYV